MIWLFLYVQFHVRVVWKWMNEIKPKCLMFSTVLDRDRVGLYILHFCDRIIFFLFAGKETFQNFYVIMEQWAEI